MNPIKGQVHSIQSLGTVDGPGLRFVVFLQGCNLSCKWCHNPEGLETYPELYVKKGGEDWANLLLNEKVAGFTGMTLTRRLRMY
mgnify:CR=1 FL=1